MRGANPRGARGGRGGDGRRRGREPECSRRTPRPPHAATWLSRAPARRRRRCPGIWTALCPRRASAAARPDASKPPLHCSAAPGASETRPGPERRLPPGSARLSLSRRAMGAQLPGDV
ncbi:small membrane A-kinase anchor protein isoform X1 [Chlorocebus sabaeus]|uniref:small membrane A-kinase anchor protein isoform X1 n=1 Tax=Chlorocebus sabaeus TaxID=60711 RepID=UPI003BF9B5F3